MDRMGLSNYISDDEDDEVPVASSSDEARSQDTQDMVLDIPSSGAEEASSELAHSSETIPPQAATTKSTPTKVALEIKPPSSSPKRQLSSPSAGDPMEERPIKRQRVSEEREDGLGSSIKLENDQDSKGSSKEAQAKLDALDEECARLRQCRARRKLEYYEEKTLKQNTEQIRSLHQKLGLPELKLEEDMKQEEVKTEVAKAEGVERKPEVRKAPKKYEILHTPKEFWEKYYKEEKSAGKKRKQPTGNNILAELLNGNSMDARAARGEVEIPGAIEPTRQREEAITRMTGPDANPNDPKILRFAVRSFGYKKVEPDPKGRKFRLKGGFNTSLYPYQVVGVSMMLSKELSPGVPKGGILADEMGLGKTVQTLAMMFSNPPTKRERAKTTLIVTTSASVSQWIAETERHLGVEESEDEVEPTFDIDNYENDDEEQGNGFSNLVHYKASTIGNIKSWKNADIIFITYNQLAAAYPSNAKLKAIQEMKVSPEEEKKLLDKICGDILKKKYYRVILDEGHSIKNYSSRMSKTCLHLTAKHKWILTGTPMHNSSEELFPYFEFLGVDPGVGPQRLVQTVGKPKAPKAGEPKKKAKNSTRPSKKDEGIYYEMLTRALEGVMIRRQTDEKFLGYDIMDIPQNHPTEFIRVEPSDAERIIYQQLASRYLRLLEEAAESEAEEREKDCFVMIAITRLRQAACHPYLLQGTIASVFCEEDFKAVRAKFAEAGTRIPVGSCMAKMLDEEQNKRIGSNGDSKVSFTAILEADPLAKVLKKGGDIEDAICSLCHQTSEDIVTTECDHIFCRDCLDAHRQSKGPICPTCEESLDNSDPSKDFEYEQDAGTPSTATTSPSVVWETPGRKKKRGKENREREHGEDELYFQPDVARELRWVQEYDRVYKESLARKMVDGAKLLAVKKHILKLQAEHPNDKIIAFTQYMGVACILARLLAEENIRFVQFCGEMSVKKKEDAKKAFHEVPEVKVMIASLKCGGVALNLTCANRVIIIDPWWNDAMEKQAFGRVARIGQNKETYQTKFIMEGTIEGNMVNLQGMKAEDIAKALKEQGKGGDGDGKQKLITCKLLGGLIGLHMKTKRGSRGGMFQQTASRNDMEDEE